MLGTGVETSKLQHADHGGPDACALQHALNALRPRRVRFVLREQASASTRTGACNPHADPDLALTLALTLAVTLALALAPES